MNPSEAAVEMGNIVVWQFCMCAGILLLAVTVAVCIRKFIRHESFLKAAVGLLTAAMIVFWLPLDLAQSSPAIAFLRSVSNSIGVFVLAPLIRDYQEVLNPDFLGGLYFWYQFFSGVFFVVAPLLTFGIVLTYFSGIVQRFMLWACGKRDLYVFSDLTERSLAIARSIDTSKARRHRKILFVFCNISKEERFEDINAEARALGAVMLTKPMSLLSLKVKGNQISYFEISDNSDDNVENTIAMVESQQKINPDKTARESVWIYCYSTDDEAEMLIDAQNSDGLRVILVNEFRDAVYQMLFRYPVYGGIRTDLGRCCSETGDRSLPDAPENIIHLMVLGGGQTGLNFLKAAIWYGQMMGWSLKITLVDREGEKIKKRLAMECPDLSFEGQGRDYDISIVQQNIFSSDFVTYLDKTPDVSYCVCALKDDEDNIRIGLFMRRYYYQYRPENQPLIFVRIRSDRKFKAVWQMHVDAKELKPKGKKKLYYRLIPFGNMGSSFTDADNTSMIEEFLGMGVHCHYYGLTDGTDAGRLSGALNDYYRLQGNRMSSIASGMHIKSRLWELGFGICEKDKDSEACDLTGIQAKVAESIRAPRNALADLEHERWMAYQRVEGWRLPRTAGGPVHPDEALVTDIGEAYSHYLNQFKNQNYLMKQHPALVPASGGGERGLLNQVRQEMKKRSGDVFDPNYWDNDLKLIDYMYQIVTGSWCKGIPVSVKGMVFEAGQLQILPLTDLLTVCLKKYDRAVSDEDIQILREKIRQCAGGILNNRFKTFDAEDKKAALTALKRVAMDELENTEDYTRALKAMGGEGD